MRAFFLTLLLVVSLGVATTQAASDSTAMPTGAAVQSAWVNG